MNAPADDALTPEQVAKYRAELAAMGWPPEVPGAPEQMHHAMHFVLQEGVRLLAERDAQEAGK
ncbi:hypothetical protein E1N52_41630 [Paraburkholderia guartelaensis]|uniref:Uncharacterized protein n=1 Tax=Paraburkholderia guartelaensis TaxID=2546446 RepID=A0A4R5L217_9BURK|nr:hypothetical protein [Paraburkholderia guartelaensis]TDG02093.1 hypothetical protein E1N52_41630 [Paraburkholderia guartelaensis]